MPAAIRAVLLDVGETVLDRTREYAAWAVYFGVPAHTFSAVFGAMISRGHTAADVVERFGNQPFATLHADRGPGPAIGEIDLYPDVRDCLAGLRRRGLAVGVCGNQPRAVGEQLSALNLDVDFVASSEEWAVAKPAEWFFLRACRHLGAAPAAVVHVGDQLGNDVAAPQRAGLRAVRIRRGPWGLLTSDSAIESSCLGVIDTLAALPELLAAVSEAEEV